MTEDQVWQQKESLCGEEILNAKEKALSCMKKCQGYSP